jgi:uncharacterized protein
MPDNKQVVREFLQALGTGDAPRMMPLLADNIEAVAMGTCLMSGTRNKEQILSTLGLLSQSVKNGIDFKILHLTAEEDRVAAEVAGSSTMVTGGPYNNNYHFLFFIRNGQIYKIKEYFCTKLVEDTFGPLLSGK